MPLCEQPSIQASLQRLVKLTSMQSRPSPSSATENPFHRRQYSHTNFPRNDDNRCNFDSRNTNFNQRRFNDYRDERNNNNNTSFTDRRMQNKHENNNVLPVNNDAIQI